MKRKNDNGSKFKNATSLLDAYNSLQSEFTKKCQELSKFKRLTERKVLEREDNQLSFAKKVIEKSDELNKIVSDNGVDGSICELEVDALKSKAKGNELLQGLGGCLNSLKEVSQAQNCENENIDGNGLDTESALNEKSLIKGLEVENLQNKGVEGERALNEATKNLVLKDEKTLNESPKNVNFEVGKVLGESPKNSVLENMNTLKKSENFSSIEASSENLESEGSVTNKVEEKSTFSSLNWREKVSDFFEKYPQARADSKEISKILISDKQIAKLDNCIEVAYAMVQNRTNNKPASKGFENDFSIEKILSNPQIKNKIIASYFEEMAGVKKQTPPLVVKKSSTSPITPSLKISSLDEARTHLLRMLKK